jgi:hypothetical protein
MQALSQLSYGPEPMGLLGNASPRRRLQQGLGMPKAGKLQV